MFIELGLYVGLIHEGRSMKFARKGTQSRRQETLILICPVYNYTDSFYEPMSSLTSGDLT